jgi:DNA-directed RNA polymerase beta' subunit
VTAGPAPTGLGLLSCGVEPRERIETELAEHRPGLRLRWLDPAELHARSRGRVTNADGRNPRTHKPERAGLACCRIFGPVEDLQCLCAKYRGDIHRGVTCEKCGVEVLEVAVRRERFGHIELPTAVPHPWAPQRALECLLVLPAGFREQPPSDHRHDLRGLNGLYQRVLGRAERLGRCIQHCAPSLIVEHETARLERAVARAFGLPRRRPGPGPTLTDHLQRTLLTLDAHAALPWALVATLAALGLAVEE